jgi:zinc protease
MPARIGGLCRGAAAIALVALCAGPAVAAPDIDDPAQRTQIEKLDNGLTVLLLPNPATPAVSFQIWVRAGSKDEATGFTGLAHLFEHMMFLGTDRLPPESHEKMIEARGGRVNAYTTADTTVFYEDVAPDSLPLVIALEAERLRNLKITDETLASEKQVVLEERRMRTEDSPEGRAFEAMLALAFQAHPYRVPTIGWRSDVENLTVEACRDFFHSYYAPSNLVVVVAGGFDPANTLALIRSELGSLPAGPAPQRHLTVEPAQRGERRAVVHMDVRSPIFAAVWHAPKEGSPDAEALDVASLVLSGGHSSRLYRKLVYEQQQAFGAEGSYWEQQEAGVFFAYASVRPDGDIAKVERLFLGEIDRLAREPVPDAELAKAKRQIEVDLLSGMETSSEMASRIGSEYVAFGRIRPVEERLRKYRAVTAADVQRVVRTYLTDDQRSVIQVMRAPKAEAAK